MYIVRGHRTQYESVSHLLNIPYPLFIKCIKTKDNKILDTQTCRNGQTWRACCSWFLHMKSKLRIKFAYLVFIIIDLKKSIFQIKKCSHLKVTYFFPYGGVAWHWSWPTHHCKNVNSKLFWQAIQKIWAFKIYHKLVFLEENILGFE